MRGATYRMFQVLAQRRGLAVSALNEQLIQRELDAEDDPIVDPGPAPAAPEPDPEPEDIHSSHFTF